LQKQAYTCDRGRKKPLKQTGTRWFDFDKSLVRNRLGRHISEMTEV